MTPIEQLAQIQSEAIAAVDKTTTLDELNAVEVEYLGRKGALTGLLRLISQLPNEEKPSFGQSVNAAKDAVTAHIEPVRARLKAVEREARLLADAIDVTLPGQRAPIGRQHVLTKQMDAVRRVLIGLGYQFVETPDVEHYHYNFETLNYPPDHPAFDEQMSFYIEDKYLLRTQTTAFQAHVMEKQKPPIRVATIGKCYRYEAVDATHSHTFHQVDILAVDEGLTLADLKGTFAHVARALFGDGVEIRFRPDFFPFVEPGVEVAIRWGDRWLELGGAGMVHPNILESMGIDSERYTGFAWGLGIDRMPMIVHKIDDLRLFTENDFRFLNQF
ncbi:MAG TPA: phenylalanine--tRNA ligase subunit alpha [Capsulimonadaceae bacterium]|jgi:phenylalanyl-tRNA synthetase alpha chain